ncbi:MAG: peptidoglycan editing factor PgeF [Clostridia bacterium]|nr:peptidoglycan editing factor PgeF [Clostridia bacterium]
MNGDYTLTMRDGVGVVTCDMLSPLPVRHGFTTRLGGFSDAPIDALNLGFNRPEPRAVIESNYKKLCGAYGVDYNKLVLVSYVHGTDVLEVTKKDCGRGIKDGLTPLPDCDGIITQDPDVVLFTLHADCSAFFVVDPVHNAIGLAHAGWRGTLGRIGEKLIRKMHECYGSVPCDMYAAVGPCICGDCYEVSRDVGELFTAEFNDERLIKPHPNDEKVYLDIRTAAENAFIQAGVPRENVGHIPCCTFENEDLFYSYRRNGRGKTGAMGAFLALGKDKS